MMLLQHSCWRVNPANLLEFADRSRNCNICIGWSGEIETCCIVFTRTVVVSQSYTLLLLLLLGSSANDLNVANTSSACVCVDKKKLGRPRTRDLSAATCR